MKVLRFLAVSAVCVALALFMVVHSFAISRFDAYSYWASAQNRASFIGNDISNMFNYSKSTGLNPPASIQSEFYKNGYYSNNIALFNQNSGGTAYYDLNSLQPVYSWTYNGIDGTSPLDNGFELVGNAPLSLGDSYATLGSWNGALAKTIYCDTSEQIAVYDFRLSAGGTSDGTNFSRVYFGFLHNGSVKSVSFSFNKTQLVFDNRSKFLDNSLGINPITSYDFSTLHDFRLIIEEDNCSLYIDGEFVKTVRAFSDTTTTDLGVKMAVWKYAYLNIYSYSFKTYVNPTSVVTVNLGRPVLIPAGDDLEFYVQMRNGSVTNLTTQTIVDFDFSGITQMNVFFNEQLAVVPIEYSNGWFCVKVPSSDVDRTLSYCYFMFTTPYVNMTIGDQLRWDMEMAFSDLVFGDPDDIGLNPDIDPEQDKFRNEVIGGINDVKQEIHDGFDIINGTLEDVRQEIQDGFDSINDAIYGDQPDVTIAPELNPEEVLGESQAIDDYMGIINDAQDGLVDYLGVEAPGWIQNFFGKILSWTGVFPFIALLLPITVVRALLGR